MKAFLLASPIYWHDADNRKKVFEAIEKALMLGEKTRWNVIRIEREEDTTDSGTDPCVVIALSGGVQLWMQKLSASLQHLALLNAYLPEALPVKLSGPLMHANAHPASTDFYAHCRMAGKSIQWLTSPSEMLDYAIAWQGVCRLKHARFLKIGETEPWVINSCRSPDTIRKRVGCDVIPIERDQLYRIYETISEEETKHEATKWIGQNNGLIGIGNKDIIKASRVTLAMKRILEKHEADGLSMACFAMIGDIDTTSCLALSALNDSANEIGACEGDLDAGLTLYLLKAMGRI